MNAMTIVNFTGACNKCNTVTLTEKEKKITTEAWEQGLRDDPTNYWVEKTETTIVYRVHVEHSSYRCRGGC